MYEGDSIEEVYEEWANRTQQIVEGNMAQREDRLADKLRGKCEIDVCEQLKGKSKKRWIKLFNPVGKAEEGDKK